MNVWGSVSAASDLPLSMQLGTSAIVLRCSEWLMCLCEWRQCGHDGTLRRDKGHGRVTSRRQPPAVASFYHVSFGPLAHEIGPFHPAIFGLCHGVGFLASTSSVHFGPLVVFCS